MNAPMMQTAGSGQNFIQQAEKARDLKAQLGALGQDDEREIQFIEWSPGRVMVTLWNTQTGEEITLPRYQALSAIAIPNPRGGYMWTANQAEAPVQRENSVKCFLHPEAPERAVLDELGITQVCMTAHLANESSKRKHARRHPSLWEQYQEELTRRERAAEKAAQAEQTAAILALATTPKKASA